MRIFSEPDIVRSDLGQKRVLTSGWIEKASAQFAEAVRTVDKLVTIDLSNIDFITLYEWSTLVAMMEPILANHLVDSIAIDLVGETSSRLIPEDHYLDLLQSSKLTSDYTRAEIALAARVYPLVKFLELLGTRNVLNNRAGRVSNVFYPFVEAATLTPSTKSRNYTVLMGLTRIDSKEDCRQFLDDHSILNWRTVMGRRFDDSPLFESEEIWRVICHELAINIWEHSHRAGFIVLVWSSLRIYIENCVLGVHTHTAPSQKRLKAGLPKDSSS